MTQTNNPISRLITMMQAGQNPTAYLQTLARNNPLVGQVMDMTRGKSPEQLRRMCENMCAERGTTLDNFARQLGITIPSER